MDCEADSFRVSDPSPAGLHLMVRLDAEPIVPRARRPQVGPLRQTRIDEHPQRRGVIKRRDASGDW